MKRTLLLTALCLLAACSGKFYDPARHLPPVKPTLRLTLVPQEPLVPGKPVTVLAKLNTIDNPTLVTMDDLEVAHTEKFHLLLIDAALTDYRHIHPQPTNTRGIWSFTFTPRTDAYRAWADVTPSFSHKQEFVMAELGARLHGGTIDRTERSEAVVDGYHFSLSFDTSPKVGGESMGTIRVTDSKGHEVHALQPVMGAYAHIVGFHDDLRTVVHTHPMGEEPAGASAAGGPELMFHLEPKKAGFVKLFAQVKIGERELFAPFGVKVAP